MKKCKHKNTSYGEAYGFCGSVASPGVTLQEPRAHGGVRFTETCHDCGMVRAVNVNQRWKETSAWSEPDET